jgi:hypothetical protein
MSCNFSILNFKSNCEIDENSQKIMEGEFCGRKVSSSPFSLLPNEIFKKILEFTPFESFITFSKLDKYNWWNVRKYFSHVYCNYITDLLPKKHVEIALNLQKVMKDPPPSLFKMRFEVGNLISSQIDINELNDLFKTSVSNEFTKIMETAISIIEFKNYFEKPKAFDSTLYRFTQMVRNGKIDELNFMILWYLNKCSESEVLSMDNLSSQRPHQFFEKQQVGSNLQSFFSTLIDNKQLSTLASLFENIGKSLLTHPVLCNNKSLPQWLINLIQSDEQKKTIEEYLEIKEKANLFSGDIFKAALCLYAFTTNLFDKESVFQKIDQMDISSGFKSKLKNSILILDPQSQNQELNKKIDALTLSFLNTEKDSFPPLMEDFLEIKI